jgi:HK97 family phage major capsid protein
MEELKKLLEQQGKAFEEFKSANDTRLKAIEEKGFAPADVEEKVNKANAEITALSKKIDDQSKKLEDQDKEIETLSKTTNRPGSPGDVSPEKAEHKKAFFGWVRKGTEGNLRELEKKAMTVGSDPGGGYLVDAEMEAGIDTVAAANVSMMRLATVQTVGSAVYQRRVRTSGPGYGWVGETESPTETTTATFTVLKYEPGTIYAEPQISSNLLEDAEFDVEMDLSQQLEEEFTEGLGEAFITGSGINRPHGITAYTTVANASYAWGSLGYIASSNAGALPDDYDEFIDLEHALKAKYRANARWLMNDATLASVRKYKTGEGIYLWQPGLQVGVPNLLLGYPYETDDYMPDVASNSLSIAFGDFKKGYLVVRRRGMVMLRDPYTAKPFVKFYTTMRYGGGIRHYEAIKFMKMAAS